ncbi:hypothetical protein EAF00_001344 [Botryotinia globosa]|nr:hypothetical protein EAF00_001344 [Botryotinia globosa]
MSAQISHISSDSPDDENDFRHSAKQHEARTKDAINPFVADIEGEGLEFERQKPREKVEAVELIPTETSQWNVDGDQSPCKFPKPLTREFQRLTRMPLVPEVAACALNTDDSSIPCNTFRAWVLMTIFVIVFAGANQFLALRYPSLSIGYIVAQLLVFPIGRAWEKLPRWRCVNISASAAYATGALVAIVTPVYWDHDNGAGFTFAFLLTTQMLGFGLAGLARRWIVYPAALIWPATLTSTVLSRSLHEPQEHFSANGWTLSRYRFFSYFTILAFFIFWFPDYLWTSLSTFAFITWIVPKNQVVNTIFGMNSGLGLLSVSFDWTQTTYAGTPLTTPFYITRNAFAVVVIFYLFLSPILYYSNVWNSAYLPLLSSSTFDNTGSSYNISRVVDFSLDFVLSKYEEYSPMCISMSYSLSYALSFVDVTAMVVHTYLYNGAEIWAKFRNS